MHDNTLLTPTEAADYLHVSTRTLIRWRQERIGPAWIKVGAKVMYHQADLQRYIDARRVEAVAEASA